MTEHPPTEEQQAIIEHVRSSKTSLLVEARAGAAKTTTIVMAEKVIPAGLTKLAVAFNVDIKDTLKARLRSDTNVMTLNGLGHRTWMRTIPARINLDKDKAGQVTREAMAEIGLPLDDRDQVFAVKVLFDRARNIGLVPEGAPGHPKIFTPDDRDIWYDIAADSELSINDYHIMAARSAMLKSIKGAYGGWIDYGDQIYMPCCFNGAFQKYDVVMVDESQDLSPMNHFMLARVMRKKMLAVGDEYQAIYAWRGAASDSMTILREKFNMDVLKLTTTFRCPQAVVNHVKGYVPDINTAPNAQAGLVERLAEWELTDIEPGSVIICRNNAPLVNLALKFFQAGIRVRYNGANEVEKTIVALLNKLGKKTTPSADALQALHTWQETETLNAEASGKMWLLGRIKDRADCVRFALQQTDTIDNAIKLIRDAFNQEGSILLSTGHRSKGLEWETVYHLDDWLIPSRFATTPEAEKQEHNLRYVISTRAKRRLAYIQTDKLFVDVGEDPALADGLI